MKGFSLIKLVVLLAALAILAICAGCDYFQPRTATAPAPMYPQFDWTATINGSGGAVTGGSLGLQKAEPTPAPLEQLEKGNSAKVAAQVKARAILPAVPTPVRATATAAPAAPVYVPMRDATDVRSSQPEPAWYNGFL